jgi:hypothetical protein
LFLRPRMNSYSISSSFENAFWAVRISDTKNHRTKKSSAPFAEPFSVFFRLTPSSGEVYGKPFRGWRNTATEHNIPLKRLTDTQVACRLEWQGLINFNIP